MSVRYIDYAHTTEAWRTAYSNRLPIILTDKLIIDPSVIPPDVKAGMGHATMKRGVAGTAPTEASQVRADVRPTGSTERLGPKRQYTCSKCTRKGHACATCIQDPLLRPADDWLAWYVSPDQSELDLTEIHAEVVKILCLLSTTASSTFGGPCAVGAQSLDKLRGRQGPQGSQGLLSFSRALLFRSSEMSIVVI